MGRNGFLTMDDARADTQSFAGFNSYDLRDFSTQLSKRAGAGLKGAALSLGKAVDDACVATTALGPSVVDAKGIAFWFPAQRGAYVAQAVTYSRLAFPRRTGWASYLRGRYR
jgi:hypothetical protein